MADDILNKGGALVSEYRFAVEPRPEFFVERDRIQAGQAQGVVMIQSDHKGGNLHASRVALEYGRWLAVPYPTEPDRINREPKVQVNMTFADGTQQERMELLRCDNSALSCIILLRSRDAYGKMVVTTATSAPALPPTQGGLL